MSDPSNVPPPDNHVEAATALAPVIVDGVKQLDWAYNIYSTCLRDYFSTFGTYTTATSILVAALGFLVRDNPFPKLIWIVAICGLFLCLQWYLSTATMRAQVFHFKRRIQELEKAANVRLLSRWLLAADLARSGTEKRERILQAEVDREQRQLAEQDSGRLTWAFCLLDSPLGLRGAMLPGIYSAVFIGVLVWSSIPSHSDQAAFWVALGWLVILPFALYLHRVNRDRRSAGL